MKKSVGIVGFGSFGKFLAERLDPYCEVLVYDKNDKSNKWANALANVAQADFVVLAVPLSAFNSVITQLKPLLGEETAIVDVCSVKERPVEIIRSILPGRKLVATHPLFGPQSASDSFNGHTLVICPEVSDKGLAQELKKIAADQRLNVKEMTCQEHDRQMSLVHGLTFFIAHILKDYNLAGLELSTPSFKRLLDLAELEKHHSEGLFYTIQNGNYFTAKVRDDFIKVAEELNENIKQHKML